MDATKCATGSEINSTVVGEGVNDFKSSWGMFIIIDRFKEWTYFYSLTH